MFGGYASFGLPANVAKTAFEDAPFGEHLFCGDDTPCIQKRKLVSGFAPHERLECSFLIFQFCIDESGYASTDPPRCFFWQVISRRFQSGKCSGTGGQIS
jgi:hypothetical protein